MVKQASLSGAAWLALLSLALIWGGSFLAFALALREVPVFTTVAWRVGLGAIVLWVVIFTLNIPRPPNGHVWGALAIMGLFNNAIPFSLIAWGQTTIESGLASILNGSTAIFAVVFAAFVFADERMTPRKTTGVLIAFIGVCIVMGWQAVQSFDPRSLAQLAIIGASISYAIAAVWARRHLSGLHPFMAATGMLTCASLIMISLAFFIDGPPQLSLQPTTLGALLFLGIPCTAVAYLLYYQTLKLAGSGNLSLVTLLIPPIAVLLGALVLGENLSPRSYIGFACIAVGMLVLDGRILKLIRPNGPIKN